MPKVFVYSHFLDDKVVNRCHKLASDLKARSCRKASNELAATHIVVSDSPPPTKHGHVCQRVLLGLVRRSHIVTVSYLEESHKAGRFLPEHPFLPSSLEDLVRSQWAPRSFSGLTVALLRLSSNRKNLLTLLLNMAGAKLVQMKDKDLLCPKTLTKIDFIFTSPSVISTDLFKDLMGQKQLRKIFSHHYIFMRIITHNAADRELLIRKFSIQSKNMHRLLEKAPTVINGHLDRNANKERQAVSSPLPKTNDVNSCPEEVPMGEGLQSLSLPIAASPENELVTNFDICLHKERRLNHSHEKSSCNDESQLLRDFPMPTPSGEKDGNDLSICGARNLNWPIASSSKTACDLSGYGFSKPVGRTDKGPNSDSLDVAKDQHSDQLSPPRTHQAKYEDGPADVNSSLSAPSASEITYEANLPVDSECSHQRDGPGERIHSVDENRRAVYSFLVMQILDQQAKSENGTQVTDRLDEISNFITYADAKLCPAVINAKTKRPTVRQIPDAMYVSMEKTFLQSTDPSDCFPFVQMVTDTITPTCRPSARTLQQILHMWLHMPKSASLSLASSEEHSRNKERRFTYMVENMFDKLLTLHYPTNNQERGYFEHIFADPSKGYDFKQYFNSILDGVISWPRFIHMLEMITRTLLLDWQFWWRNCRTKTSRELPLLDSLLQSKTEIACTMKKLAALLKHALTSVPLMDILHQLITMTALYAGHHDFLQGKRRIHDSNSLKNKVASVLAEAIIALNLNADRLWYELHLMRPNWLSLEVTACILTTKLTTRRIKNICSLSVHPGFDCATKADSYLFQILASKLMAVFPSAIIAYCFFRKLARLDTHFRVASSPRLAKMIYEDDDEVLFGQIGIKASHLFQDVQYFETKLGIFSDHYALPQLPSFLDDKLLPRL